MRASLLLALVCELLLAADGPRERPAMKDNEKIQGTWLLQFGERHGKALPESVVKSVKLVFAGDTLTTKTGDRANEYKFTLQSQSSPKEIDLDMNGNVGLGIYQLDDDTLKIVHGEVGGARPTKFDTKDQPGLTVLELKREER